MTIYESIKALDIKTSMTFNLVFAKNTILSSFFFIFLNYWPILFKTWSIEHIFNPTSELAMPRGIPTKKAKAELKEIQ